MNSVGQDERLRPCTSKDCLGQSRRRGSLPRIFLQPGFEGCYKFTGHIPDQTGQGSPATGERWGVPRQYKPAHCGQSINIRCRIAARIGWTIEPRGARWRFHGVP